MSLRCFSKRPEKGADFYSKYVSPFKRLKSCDPISLRAGHSGVDGDPFYREPIPAVSGVHF